MNKEFPDHAKLKDWQRALMYWRVIKHRHGLTIPGLAHVTGRDQDTLWKEIKNPRNMAGAMYCHGINAPVIIMSQRWNFDGDLPRLEIKPAAWLFDSAEYMFDELPEAEQKTRIQSAIVDMMAKYPAPKYQGWRHDKGQGRFTPVLLLPKLREAAQGLINPFTGRKPEACG